jgi:hypothetical protein
MLPGDLYGAYQVLNGGQVVRAVYNDWSPEQTCTDDLHAEPAADADRPAGRLAMRFAGPKVVYFGGDLYTRQR